MSDYAVIICARMGSTRLPGKALAELAPGVVNLAQIVGRWRESRRDPVIVVATSDWADDYPIAMLCDQIGARFYRGPRDDVVARMDGALREFAPEAKWVARALADNPLVDVGLADWRLDVLRESGAEGVWYGGSESRPTYAATTDVWSRAAWERIAAESSGSQREHPGAFYWDNLSRFYVVQLPLPRREYMLAARTELDTAEDLEVFRAVWRQWSVVSDQSSVISDQSSVVSGQSSSVVPTLWALEWLAMHPEVTRLNADVPVKTQTMALWPKGQAWFCPDCQGRVGAIVAGDLEVRCGGCGRPRKWYSQRPRRK